MTNLNDSRIRRVAVAACWLLNASVVACFAQNQDSETLFESQVRPVLVEVCFKCHGGDKTSGGLRVDSREALVKGGDSGAAIVSGKPGESLLLKALRHEDNDFKMPPDKKLPEAAIAAFEAWIASGAVWPQGRSGPFVSKRHWAFQPVARPVIPPVRSKSKDVRTAVDRFVVAKLDEAGLAVSAEADSRTLIRRATFDLTGLPPSGDEVAEFLVERSTSTGAYERLIDRLLASPQYGERWARYWLDVARYSDTKGYVFNEDRNYPFAFKYRDWVAQSLNDDLGYNQFLIRQIAGDLLPEPERTANLPALGFLTLGRRFLNNINDIIDDRIDVVCRGTMGLTVSCARCHDHKFDPIPAADYYSLYGVFRSSHEPNADEAKTLMAMTLVEDEKPFDPYVFLRGQQGNHGPKVPRQFLSVVAGAEQKPFANRSGRLELAQAIASPTNPLTARVIVNRVWMLHFGAPLVRTPSDFGLRAEPPSHPELLDWLASEFIAHGWSLKWLHRELMLSSVYRQASQDKRRETRDESQTDLQNSRLSTLDARLSSDPENRLLSRMNRRRLDWESLRDSLLFASGKLDRSLGGPATDILKSPFTARRTIYGFIDRQNLPLTFRNFDFASPDTHAPNRFVTSVPQQTLFLRNSPFALEQARALAELSFEPATAQSPDARILKLFRLAYGRSATADEIALARSFVAEAGSETTPSPIWQFGYGEYDVAAKQLKNFTPFPHWTGRQWQGGAKLPDPDIGWAMWHANGGHPGDAKHSAILRWTAPQDVTVVVSGKLQHPAKEGDGVQAFVWNRRLGEQAQFVAAHSETDTFVPAMLLRQGETLDFIVACLTNENSDSFQWAPKLVATGQPLDSNWDLARDFPNSATGQTLEHLTGWEQLAQVLLLSNEFQFVD